MMSGKFIREYADCCSELRPVVASHRAGVEVSKFMRATGKEDSAGEEGNCAKCSLQPVGDSRCGSEELGSGSVHSH